ncbi:MAG: PDZ domain-containing protein [Acidobacteriota bacterium]
MDNFKSKFLNKGVLFLLAIVMIFAGTVSQVMAGKGETKGFLGVNIEKMSGDDREEFGVSFGVLLTSVSKGEAAEKAGLKKYDVIQYVDGEKMRRPDDLVSVISKKSPGTKVKIVFVRDGKEKKVSAVLGQRKVVKYDFKKKFDLQKDFGKRIFKFKGGGGYLGVHLMTMKSDLASYFSVKKGEGALITDIEKESPAAKAGLKAGDVLLEIGKDKVKNAADVSEIIGDYKKGDKLKITYLRHKKRGSVIAVLGEKKWNKFIKIAPGKIHFDIPRFEKEVHIWTEKDKKKFKEQMKKEQYQIQKQMKKMKVELKKVKEEEIKKIKELKKLKKIKETKDHIYI